jgi:hypothetical protein
MVRLKAAHWSIPFSYAKRACFRLSPHHTSKLRCRRSTWTVRLWQALCDCLPAAMSTGPPWEKIAEFVFRRDKKAWAAWRLRAKIHSKVARAASPRPGSFFPTGRRKEPRFHEVNLMDRSWRCEGNVYASRLTYLVTWVNKPMPCPDPQTPQDGVLTNKTARI